MNKQLKMGFVGLIFLSSLSQSFSQSSYAYQTFRDTRIVNGQSSETNPMGEMKFIMAHRFGLVNTGLYNMFGLDNATMRIGLDYGVLDALTIGLGRSSFEKSFDAFLKWKFLWQQSGEKNMPISAVLYADVLAKAERWSNPDLPYIFAHRLFYTTQLLLARKFDDRFSLQLMPTMVHRNLVQSLAESHDVFSIGLAPSLRITKGISISAEYYHTPTNQLAPGFHSSLAFGVDIETKGHVFQIHLSNSRGMTEKFFVTETRGDWTEGEFHIGFNFSRDFKITKRKQR